MTSIFIIYIIGYIISFSILVLDTRKEKDIRLCDLFGITLISLFSWASVATMVICVIWQYIEDNWDVVIFKKKNNGNK